MPIQLFMYQQVLLSLSGHNLAFGMQLCRHDVLQSCILELLLKSARGVSSSRLRSTPVVTKLYGASSE